MASRQNEHERARRAAGWQRVWIEPDAASALKELSQWRYPTPSVAATAAIVNEHKRVLRVIAGEKT